MITQRAFLVAIVGFCFYLIAIVNELPTVFYALTWLTISILLSSLGIALLSLVGLNCRWRADGVRVNENLGALSGHESSGEGPSGGPSVELALSNVGTLNKTNVVLEIRLRECRDGDLLKRRFLLEALPSGASVECALQLYNLPRGRYRITGIRMMGSDVLGLFRIQRQVLAVAGTRFLDEKAKLNSGCNEDDLIVGPAMLSLQGANLAAEGGASAGEGSSARYHGQSDELRGTRPYVAGDDLRRVHWKSTARLGSLVVKEFHRTTHAQAIVVWDAALADAAPGQQGPLCEYSLRLAASLCRTLTERGRPCSLLRLDANPLWCSPTGAATLNGGFSFLPRVTEVLADAQPGRQSSFSKELRNHLANVPLGSQIYLLSAAPILELREAVRMCMGRSGRVVVGVVGPAPQPPEEGHALLRTNGNSQSNGLGSAESLEAEFESLGQNRVQFVRIAPSLGSIQLADTLRQSLRALLDGSGGPRSLLYGEDVATPGWNRGETDRADGAIVSGVAGGAPI